MKKVLLILLLLLCSCGGTKFYFFGVDTDIVKEGGWEGAGVMALGAFLSFAAHETGHALTKDGTSWEGRSGFILQNGIGLALTSFESTRYSYLTKGYVGLAAFETWSYPLRRGWGDNSDLGLIGDSAEVEWAIYSTVALHNVLRVPWSMEDQPAKK